MQSAYNLRESHKFPLSEVKGWTLKAIIKAENEEESREKVMAGIQNWQNK